MNNIRLLIARANELEQLIDQSTQELLAIYKAIDDLLNSEFTDIQELRSTN